MRKVIKNKEIWLNLADTTKQKVLEKKGKVYISIFKISSNYVIG